MCINADFWFLWLKGQSKFLELSEGYVLICKTSFMQLWNLGTNETYKKKLAKEMTSNLEKKKFLWYSIVDWMIVKMLLIYV